MSGSLIKKNSTVPPSFLPGVSSQFARCTLEDRPPAAAPGNMGLRDMKIIAAIYEAASIRRISEWLGRACRAQH